MSNQQGDPGFTVTEVLIGMLIGSIMIAFSLSAYQFSIRAYNRWEREKDLESNTVSVFQTLRNDIARAKFVDTSMDSASMILIGGRSVIYRCWLENVYRNGQQMNREGIKMVVQISDSMHSQFVSIRSKDANRTCERSGIVTPMISAKESMRRGW